MKCSAARMVLVPLMLITLVGYLPAPGAPAVAQESDESASGEEQEIREEITVTATKRGEIGLRVSMTGAFDDEAHIAVEVWDTGVGMTERQQLRVFQPFTQGRIDVSRVYGGTGLGLAICRQIVERHGGTIRLLDADRGAAFEIRLPR